MRDHGSDVIESLGTLTGKWTIVAAFGTFLLYLVGYLTLRFELHMYGVSTSVDTFDEKYLFAGCSFFVYLTVLLPLVLLILLLLAAFMFLLYSVLPANLKSFLKRCCATLRSKPNSIIFAGVIMALIFIQTVLKCAFAYGNLLVRTRLPDYEWLNAILLTSPTNRDIFFQALIATTLVTASPLLLASNNEPQARQASTPLVRLLIGLVIIESLLLAVNYGVLIYSQYLPRVSDVRAVDKLAVGSAAWLVWENKDVLTYFVRDMNKTGALVTISRRDTEVRIVGEDAIFQILFGAK